MNQSNQATERESLILRAVWMLIFFFVWQLAELRCWWSWCCSW